MAASNVMRHVLYDAWNANINIKSAPTGMQFVGSSVAGVLEHHKKNNTGSLPFSFLGLRKLNATSHTQDAMCCSAASEQLCSCNCTALFQHGLHRRHAPAR
mmetsp:Transcript_30094/g.66693  ORF Transcript_30094/g.66693 Transcript_30094/m.66693 type:complete len:101 (+) Transcript_30094:522-824(+)